MAAFKAGFLHGRQEAQDRQARLPLQHRRERRGAALGCVGKDQRRDAALFAEVHEPFYLRRKCQAAALGVYDKHNRRSCQARKVPGAGLRGIIQSIVKTHGPFDHGNVRVHAGESLPDALHALQEKVEIAAGDAQDVLMEHGVDIIRAAFEGLHTFSALFER